MLGLPGAQSLARDRCERIVSRHHLPAPREEIWRAMTEPARLKSWLAACHGSLMDTGRECVLDFEDGEFFLCRPTLVQPQERLEFLWRWLGIGPARQVRWQLESTQTGTAVTATEEAVNPPNDWRSWHGDGWPGILDQLAAHLRTGTEWRWPWRRMGPYAVIELPVFLYDAWDRLFSPAGPKYWLFAQGGPLQSGQRLSIIMGDASGPVSMEVQRVVPPGEEMPSFLPSITFSLSRQSWGCSVGGRLWLEPGGWGSTIAQVLLYGWENLPSGLQLPERRLLTGFWADALRRAFRVCSSPGAPAVMTSSNGAETKAHSPKDGPSHEPPAAHAPARGKSFWSRSQ